jgi:hypothetical protein
VNVSSSFIGKRYGYDVKITGPGPFDVDGVLIKEKLTNITDFYFNFDDLFTPGLNLGAGMHNIFNQNLSYLQPYFGLQPPIPGPSRELYFKASYQFPFKPNKKKQKR